MLRTKIRRAAFFAGASLSCFTISTAAMAAPEALFERVNPSASNALPPHAVAAQGVTLNRRALNAPTLTINLFGEEVVAVRDRIERKKAGEVVWIGHLEGHETDTVIITGRGSVFSGMIQRGSEMYRISGAPGGGNRLLEIDLPSLPADDAYASPDGGGAFTPGAGDFSAVGDNTVQDLLVVYTQGACSAAGSCAQLEADITTAVADINTAYAESGITITMNLAGMALTNYTGTNASTALSDLRGTSDGQMDEVHGLRDSLGADVVSLIYDGQGCGIGYLGSSASTAFNVTDEPCLVGNRTMAHEIGHNQGAHHDRVTAGAGTSSSYNYGYRRCNDGSVDDFGSPYFRTVLSYSCTSSPRVGRFSNPNINYSGVPQGVDPAVSPTKGAWNARTLNESAAFVAGFRDAPTTTPPADPSGLSASAAGPDAIDIGWADNSSNETSFVVQRSLDGASWATVATVGANTTSFADNGLDAETTYFYRVRADNGAGSSGYTNTASATTDGVPAIIDDVANGEIAGTGSVSGTFAATQSDNGVAQTITEASSGGPKKSRRQSFTHTWTFDVFGGAGGVVLTANAWVSGGEGANFYYSTDNGASYNLMFTVDENATSTTKTFALPGATSGNVRIQARDASQENGEPVDSLSVDYLVITSNTEVGEPPAAPSNMAISGVTSSSVSMSFLDNADNEFGFEIWRAASDPGANCNAGGAVDTVSAQAGTGSVTYTDMTAAPSSTYWYWAKAFNGAGENGQCSNAASATTNAAPAISAAASGYKIKGAQTVDLTWSGAGGAQVDIRRNGSVVATTANDGAYTDNIGAKGGGSYTYEVCEAGSATICSQPLNVIF